MYSRIREIGPNIRASWRSLDLARLTILVVSVLFILGGAMAIVTDAIAPSSMGPNYHALYSWITAGVGVLGLVGRWDRWNPRWRLLFPIAAIVLTSAAAAADGESFGVLLAVYPLAFVLTGFILPPGSSLMLAPGAGAIMVITSPDGSSLTITALVILLPISTLVGEAVAQLVGRMELGEQRVEQLLDTVRVLSRADDEMHGSQWLATAVADLVELDSVTVMLTGMPHRDRFVQAAFHGSPELGDAAPSEVDIDGVPASVRGHEVCFFTNGDRADAGVLGSDPVQSLVTLPLRARHGDMLGLVVGSWATPRWRFSSRERQAAGLLAQEGARMLERLRATQQLAHEAHTDPLTELANRRTFSRALETLQPGDAVVVIDLDHFKSVNDRFGHAAGDEALRDFARVLQRVARQVDTVARYGGEEFALILVDAHRRGAEVMIERLRALWRSIDPPTTFSAGIAVHPDDRTSLVTLRAADRALYRAKESGRDCVRVAEKSDSLSAA